MPLVDSHCCPAREKVVDAADIRAEDPWSFVDAQSGAWCSENKGPAGTGGCYMVGFALGCAAFRTPS